MTVIRRALTFFTGIVSLLRLILSGLSIVKKLGASRMEEEDSGVSHQLNEDESGDESEHMLMEQQIVIGNGEDQGTFNLKMSDGGIPTKETSMSDFMNEVNTYMKKGTPCPAAPELARYESEAPLDTYEADTLWKYLTKFTGLSKAKVRVK